MLRYLRTHRLALRSLRGAERSLHIGGASSANEILNINQLDPGELSSQQASRIYSDRTVRDAVIMQLIDVGSFWLCQSQHAATPDKRNRADSHYKVVLEAATSLSIAEHTNEVNHRELVGGLMRQQYQQERKYREMQ